MRLASDATLDLILSAIFACYAFLLPKLIVREGYVVAAGVVAAMFALSAVGMFALFLIDRRKGR